MGVMVLPPLSVGGPGFNEFVSGPYRLGGNAPVSGTSPTVLPSNSAEAAVREGRGRGSAPSGRAPIPLGRRRSFDPCHESLRGNGRVRGPFHSPRSADRGVNIANLPRAARGRVGFLSDPP